MHMQDQLLQEYGRLRMWNMPIGVGIDKPYRAPFIIMSIKRGKNRIYN